MSKKTSVLIIFLLLVAAFLAGSTVAKVKYSGGEKKAPTAAGEAKPTLPPFTPKKSAEPEVKFFVMSFCPFGNQAEMGLEPVYQLLKDKVSWQPRYVIYKDYCSQAPVEQKEKCEKDYCIKSGRESFCSMHGLQEFNQNIREICAFNLDDQDKWWKFVSAVNQKCTSQNVDVCWLDEAKAAGLDTNKITGCEKTQKISLAQKEVAEMEKYQTTGSPMVFINDVLYNGGRAPEDYKKAICSAFENPPEECGKVLGQESAPASGGCQ